MCNLYVDTFERLAKGVGHCVRSWGTVRQKAWDDGIASSVQVYHAEMLVSTLGYYEGPTPREYQD